MPISSSPATFTIPGGTGEQDVTFAIPSGSYVSGTWDVIGTCGDSHSDNVYTEGDPGNSQAFSSQSSGAFSESVAVGVAQLADVNAAAGGNLNATYGSLSFGLSDLDVTSFTLTLVAASGTTVTLDPIELLGVVVPPVPDVDQTITLEAIGLQVFPFQPAATLPISVSMTAVTLASTVVPPSFHVTPPGEVIVIYLEAIAL